MILSREQLAKNMRALPRHVLEAKLASGELTDEAREVAAAELSRRDQEGEPTSPQERVPSGTEPHSGVGRRSIQDLTGWSGAAWGVAFFVALLLVLPFGCTAKNTGDQSFLVGVIIAQATLIAGLFRALASVFDGNSFTGTAARLLAIAAIGIALFALTTCSVIAQSGWKGG